VSNSFAQAIEFPARKSTHEGRWVPLFVEPMVGSGERICIGIAASDGEAVEVVAVPRLERLASVYGSATGAFQWTATLALQECEFAARNKGLEALADLKPTIGGLSFGAIRRGAGRDLGDLARVALRQASALAALDSDELAAKTAPTIEATQSSVISSVRKIVGKARPELREYFNRTFSLRQGTRPLQFGFVGKKMAVNFSSLHAQSANGLAAQVDKAKARLLDLESLRDGRMVDALALRPKKLAYELFVHRPHFPKRSPAERLLREAEAALEQQADEFRIQWRPFDDHSSMARGLLQREAA